MTEQKPPLKRVYTLRFTLVGIGFGLLFPILATLIELLSNRIPISLTSVWNLHYTTPLLLIIDTAPFFLGLFSYFIGVRQDTLLHSNVELQRRSLELKATQSSIEQRIQEQTQDIFQTSKKLEAVAQVARETSAIHELNQLFDQVTHLTSNRFGYYHVGIFLLDDSGKIAILQAANSEGGRRMLERGHRLQVGEVGIVGHVAESGKTRIALDVGEDAVFFHNPDLPETRSEMALPLKIREKVIGIFDIQSTQPQAFIQEDIDILQILADQVAISIDNARLLLQSQAIIQQLQTISTGQTRQAWQDTLHGKVVGYSYNPLGFRPLGDGNLHPENPYPEASHLLKIPIILRGQEIGRINLLRSPTQPPWGKREQALAISISDQAALALENARLLQGAQQRAERERTIGEATARMRETLDIDSVLRTAVEEMRNSFGLKQAEVRLQNNQTSESRKQEISKGAGK